MIAAGNPAARAAAYDDPGVREAYPMADLIRDSIDSACPRPGHAVLRRRLGVGAADVASAGERAAAEHAAETDECMGDVLSGDSLL